MTGYIATKNDSRTTVLGDLRNYLIASCRSILSLRCWASQAITFWRHLVYDDSNLPTLSGCVGKSIKRDAGTEVEDEVEHQGSHMAFRVVRAAKLLPFMGARLVSSGTRSEKPDLKELVERIEKRIGVIEINQQDFQAAILKSQQDFHAAILKSQQNVQQDFLRSQQDFLRSQQNVQQDFLRSQKHVAAILSGQHMLLVTGNDDEVDDEVDVEEKLERTYADLSPQ